MSKINEYFECCPFNLSTAKGQALFLWTTFEGELDNTPYEVRINQIRMRASVYKEDKCIFTNFSEIPSESELKDTAILLYNEVNGEPSMVNEMLS